MIQEKIEVLLSHKGDLAEDSTLRWQNPGGAFCKRCLLGRFEGWQGFEHRDRKEGSSHIGKNVSKGVETRNYRQEASSSFVLPGCIKTIKKENWVV